MRERYIKPPTEQEMIATSSHVMDKYNFPCKDTLKPQTFSLSLVFCGDTIKKLKNESYVQGHLVWLYFLFYVTSYVCLGFVVFSACLSWVCRILCLSFLVFVWLGSVIVPKYRYLCLSEAKN